MSQGSTRASRGRVLTKEDPSRARRINDLMCETAARDVVHNVRERAQGDGNECIIELWRKEGGWMTQSHQELFGVQTRWERMADRWRSKLHALRVETKALAARQVSANTTNEERATYLGHLHRHTSVLDIPSTIQTRCVNESRPTRVTSARN